MENKYGIIFCLKTKNLGDDIQTYAALKYLPKIDYVIDREKLDRFVPKEKYRTKVITNGWFLHDKKSWPMSPFINPLLISMHLTNQLQKDIPNYLKDIGTRNFKNNGPVGCRDKLTLNMLKQLGIESYLSGCLTLTIDIKKENRSNNIILVDIPKKVENHIKSKCSNVVTFTHSLEDNYEEKYTFEERMNLVEERLAIYKGAKCVITSRLHCALPCLALGVPILLVYDNKNIDVVNRISSFLPLLNFYTEEAVLSDKGIKYLENPISNKEDYKKIAKNLEKKCKEFINNKEMKISEIDNELYLEYYVRPMEKIRSLYKVEDIKWIEQALKISEEDCDKLKKDNKKLIKDNTKLVKDNKEFGLLNENFIKEIYFYEKIINSRSVRFVRKISSLIKKDR